MRLFVEQGLQRKLPVGEKAVSKSAGVMRGRQILTSGFAIPKEAGDAGNVPGV
jgi:hypothetical protein